MKRKLDISDKVLLGAAAILACLAVKMREKELAKE
jgi:hypothetical protein